MMDEDDLIERELEDGVELAAENEKNKRDRRQSWSKSENLDCGKDHEDVGVGNHLATKGQLSRGSEGENAEEGEMLDDASPMLSSRKRKPGSPRDRQLEVKKRHDYMPSYHHDYIDDGHRMSRVGYADRDHRRHSQENHL